MQLDLNRPEAMAALKKLLGTADAFVTNLRQPALESQGLDYDTLSKEVPGLVYAHFTAWGRDGPKKDDPGYDVGAFWAATGLQFYARASEDDDLPRFVGGIGDYSTPTGNARAPTHADPRPLLSAATCRDLVMGVTSALFRRERTGKGTLVDACLLRSGIFTTQGPVGQQVGAKARRGEFSDTSKSTATCTVGAAAPLASSSPHRSCCTCSQRHVQLLQMQGRRLDPDARPRKSASSPRLPRGSRARRLRHRC